MWGRAFDQAFKEQRAVKTASLAPAGVSVHHNLLVSLSEFVSFQINSIDVHPQLQKYLFFTFLFIFFSLGCICFKEPSSGCRECLLSHRDASTCYLWKSGFELCKAGQATSMAPFGKLGARLAKCLWILQCGNCSVNLKWDLFLLQQYKQQVGQDCKLAINVGKKNKKSLLQTRLFYFSVKEDR